LKALHGPLPQVRLLPTGGVNLETVEWASRRVAALMIELAGAEDKLEAFVELLSPYGVIELARTGVIAMPRGNAAPMGRRVLARAARAGDDDAGPGLNVGDLPPG